MDGQRHSATACFLKMILFLKCVCWVCECMCLRGYGAVQAGFKLIIQPKMTFLACAFKYWDYRQGHHTWCVPGWGQDPGLQKTC